MRENLGLTIASESTTELMNNIKNGKLRRDKLTDASSHGT